MARPPKKEGEAFTYDARTKIPQWLHDAIQEEADRRLVKPSDIHRELLLERYRDHNPALKNDTKTAKKEGK